MKRTPFNKIRPITDGQLAAALTNHKYVLERTVAYCAVHRRFRYVRWAWNLIVAAALAFLLAGCAAPAPEFVKAVTPAVETVTVYLPCAPITPGPNAIRVKAVQR